jgi:hypothetical protein
MSTVCRFAVKFASLISAVLHCFDRVVFKGHLDLAQLHNLRFFVDYHLGVRRDYFIKTLAPRYADRLVEHAQQLAHRSGRPYLYRRGHFRKDDWAHQLVLQDRVREGLIGIVCTMETCQSFGLRRGEKRPEFVALARQQRVLYYYFLDPRFGLLHVRLQTWLPFTVQVCVNGHEYLGRQLARKHSGFVQHDNAFTRLDDPALAQRLADGFASLDWETVLSRWARKVNPLLRAVLAGQRTYWVVDQAEYASDLLFKNRAALAELYPKLLEHAVQTFTPKDIFGFLGSKWRRNFDGQVQSDYDRDRWYGTRIKHHLQRNWLKLYDKFAVILRVETVINNPKAFWVHRPCRHRDGTISVGHFKMTKSVRSLGDYQQKALACNHRYLDALAVVDDPTPAFQQWRRLTEPQHVQGRSSAGFNPARRDDQRLFLAVLAGDGIPQGFRNADVRRTLFGAARAKADERRQSAAVGRRLKRLHDRQLLAKIPHTHRWRVTERGRQLLSTTVKLYRQTWPQLAA